MATESAKRRYPFAIQEARSGLFKFRAYADNNPVRDREQRDRVQAMIRDGGIYFAYPREFNDPFECVPEFRSDLTPKALRVQFAKEANKIGKQRNRPLKERLELSERARNRDPIKFLSRLAESHRSRIAKGVTLFCVSAEATDLLQWSHYAAGHSGVCIAFNSKTLVLGGAIRVHYSETFPKVSFPVDEEELLKSTLLTKSTHWAHEKEYRLFSLRIGGRPWDLGLRWAANKQNAWVDPTTVVGVILGARMEDQDRKELIDFCGQFRPDLWIKRAHTAANEFKLKFEVVQAGKGARAISDPSGRA